MSHDIFDLEQNIIHVLGLEAWPEEKRVALIGSASELVQKRVMLRLMDGLDEAGAAAAEKLADNPEALLAFLSARAETDIATMLSQEIEKVRSELRLDMHGKV